MPQAALAGVLLFVARRIFRLSTILTVARQAPAEFALILSTAFAIILLPIESHEWSDEKVGIRERSTDAVQIAERLMGGSEQRDEIVRVGERRGQIIRHKSPLIASRSATYPRV